MSYQYKTIDHPKIPQHKKELSEFFLKLGYDKDYPIAIENSAFICICLFNNVIVGAGRVISDLHRFAFIVDLNVKPDYQRKGIGTRLIKNIVRECRDDNINQVEISTDPNLPWIEAFYTKAGFRKIANSVAMEYNPKTNFKNK